MDILFDAPGRVEQPKSDQMIGVRLWPLADSRLELLESSPADPMRTFPLLRSIRIVRPLTMA